MLTFSVLSMTFLGTLRDFQNALHDKDRDRPSGGSCFTACGLDREPNWSYPNFYAPQTLKRGFYLAQFKLVKAQKATAEERRKTEVVFIIMPVIAARFLLRGALSLEWRRYLTHILLPPALNGQ